MYVFLNLDSEAGARGPLAHLGPGCDSFPQSSSHAAEESAPGVAENSWNVVGAQLGWRQGRRRDSPSSPGAGPGPGCLPLLRPTRFSRCVSPRGQGLLSAVSCDQGPSGVTPGCGGAFLFFMQPFKTFLAGRISHPRCVCCPGTHGSNKGKSTEARHVVSSLLAGVDPRGFSRALGGQGCPGGAVCPPPGPLWAPFLPALPTVQPDPAKAGEE